MALKLSPFAIAKAVWSMVAASARKVSPFVSIQYVTKAVDLSSDNEVTGIDVTLGTTLTNASNAFIIGANIGDLAATAGSLVDPRWVVVNTTTVRIISPNSTATAGLFTFAAWVIEFN